MKSCQEQNLEQVLESMCLHKDHRAWKDFKWLVSEISYQTKLKNAIFEEYKNCIVAGDTLWRSCSYTSGMDLEQAKQKWYEDSRGGERKQSEPLLSFEVNK